MRCLSSALVKPLTSKETSSPYCLPTDLTPLNLAAAVPYHASQLYARNLANFVVNLVADGAVQLDKDDEIVRDSMVTRGGEIVHPRVREALGLDAARPSE